MDAVSLFWDTNMAAMTPCENRIELKLRQTNSSFLFVFLSLKCQACLTFVMKIIKIADFRQTLQISHSDVISILSSTLIF